MSDYFAPDALEEIGRLDVIAEILANGLQQGKRRSRLLGFSTEFSDYKAYTPGDDPRLIDWRVKARSDKLVVKRYEAETNVQTMLLLDASASMAWRWEQTPSKLLYATHIYAALILLAIRQQDQVGLLVSDGSQVRAVPPRASANQLGACCAIMEHLRPGGGSALPELAEHVHGLKKQRGLIYICSDLEEEPAALETAIKALLRPHDQIVLIHLLDAAEVQVPFLRATAFIDSETGERQPVNLPYLKRTHAERLQTFRDHWSDFCRDHGIVYVPVDTGMPYIDTVMAMVNEMEG